MSNGGTIAISSTDTGVTGTIDVEVKSGEAIIDVTNSSLSGSKIVSVDEAAKKATIKVTPKVSIPDKLTPAVGETKSVDVNIINKTDDEIKVALGNSELTADEITKIKEFISSFELDSSTGAKVVINKNSDSVDVSIVFESAVNNVEIKNV